MKEKTQKVTSNQLKLKKIELVNLSKANSLLPEELTPQVAGGWGTFWTVRIVTPTVIECGVPSTNACPTLGCPA